MDQISYREACLVQAHLFWEEMKGAAVIKIPIIFYLNSRAMGMIDNNLIREEEAYMLLCGCWLV
jgi:hypothetical protein